MRTRRIVVGTDGTASAHAAVRWAAHEAARTGAALRIVHVFDPEWGAAPDDAADPARRSADLTMAAALDQARAVAPACDIRVTPLSGSPAARLLEAAGDADLVVLGNRGRGGLASVLLGSVSRSVATHANGPVVIVRGRGDTAGAPVVVGVDDSDTAESVLAAAFQAAADRDSPLTVIRSFLPPVALWVGAVPATTIATPQDDAVERERLTDLVRPWREKYPRVAVRIAVTHDSAAAVLADASHRARLVVVGSHGHGPVTSALLGSTGLHLLHHAGCPVLVVRPHQRDREPAAS